MLMKLTTGVDFTNILHAAFRRADPISSKKTNGLTLFYAILGSALVNSASKMLVKLTLARPGSHINEQLFCTKVFSLLTVLL
jgi:hypothetical protein